MGHENSVSGAFRNTVTLCFGILFSALALIVFDLTEKPFTRYILILAVFLSMLRLWIYYTHYLGNPDYPEDFLGDIYNLFIGYIALVAVLCISRFINGLFLVIGFMYVIDYFWCCHEIRRLSNESVALPEPKLKEWYLKLFRRWQKNSKILAIGCILYGITYFLARDSSRLDLIIGDKKILTTSMFLDIIASLVISLISIDRFRKVKNDLEEKSHAINN